MATATNEASLIDFCDENGVAAPAQTNVDENILLQGATGVEKKEISGTTTVVTAVTTTVDTSPAEFLAKHRNANQAEYDSGVEDDNHGKKTMSPDTPSPGAHSPPLQQEDGKGKQQTLEPSRDVVVAPVAVKTKTGPKAERPKTATSSASKVPAPAKNTTIATRPKTTSTPSQQTTTKSPRTTTTTTVRTTTTTTAKTAKKIVQSKEPVSTTTNTNPPPKPNVKNVQSKVGSLDYAAHKPGGGNVKIESKKLDFATNAKSKIGANENLHHTPRGGDKKIETRKLDWKAESRIGSMQNASHKAAGGNVKVVTQKLEWKAQSKIGSLENTNHKPTGGNVKIKDEKVDFSKVAKSKIGSLENASHKPGGGNVKILNEKIKIEAASKIGSMPSSAPVSARSTSSPAPSKEEE